MKTVLLVDDELDLLKVIGSRIQGWGYILHKASSGEEALGLLKNKRPDIVVLDYMLPDMDGKAVLKEIRSIDKELPVIMFTAYPSPDKIEDTENLGISAFIPKFSAYSDIQDALKTALELALNNTR